MSIDPRDRQRILEIAREVRKHVRRKSGAYCPPEGLCGEASIALSTRLIRARIPHEIWIGMWKGPTKRASPEKVDPESDLRAHTWIEFPQYDAILDVTADQYDFVPPIWFPANREWYHGLERYDLEKILKGISGRQIRDPLVPLSGPRFRRPPKGLKVRVREHLKHPPRSCLCHKSKAVDRARKSLVRRLK